MTQAGATEAREAEQKPAPTFDAIPLGNDVRKAVDALGYINPTPVQLAVYEPATRGRNLVVQARTGTGKTAAFGLPIVDALVKRSQENVQALILTPTRELALQVSAELEQLARFRGTKIVAVYGGAPMGRQVAALEAGAQIVAGTPGRVLDHIRRGTLDTKHIRIFVLDEADEMLSMGFAKELNAIIETLPKDRQGLYFSATIPPDVERLANNHLREPEYVTLSSDQVGALEINHFVYLVREGDKRGALARIIEVEDPESAIVFCNTKDETERVAELLKSRGYEADWLNGDLEQRERERVMSATREGKLRFLVATDVAARGIDISHLTHVINADFPESAEAYVHRTGRTGRAGKTGTAISVVGPKDVGHLYMLRLTYKIRPIERMLPTQGELRTRAESDLVGFLSDAYATRPVDTMHLAVARRLLTHEQADLIVAGLLADHLGAAKQDVPQVAADARRGKNPPPVRTPERMPVSERQAPRTLRDGEPREAREQETERKPERPRDERPRDERGPVDRSVDRGPDRSPRRDRDRGERRERPPQSHLSSWEPPADADDDKPLFSDSGTRPGLGPKIAEAGGERAGDRGGDRGRGGDRDRGRGGDRDRGRASPRGDRDRRPRGHDIDTSPRMPGITIEDAPRSAPQRASASLEDAPTSVGDDDTIQPSRREERDDDPAFQNIFLNVGRRDGLRADDVQKLVVDLGGIAQADVGHIRLRDRMTFVGVRKEHAERVIKALIGQTVGSRTLNAEPARGSS